MNWQTGDISELASRRVLGHVGTGLPGAISEWPRSLKYGFVLLLALVNIAPVIRHK